MPAPALQPLTVIGGVAPWAAWAFDAAAGLGADRSGNGRALTLSAPSASPSRRGDGHSSAYFAAINGDYSYNLANTWDAGDLTICGWLQAGNVQATMEGWWLGFGPGQGGNQCILGHTTTGKFLYVADPSGGVVSDMAFPSAADWVFASVRRSVAGNWVRWGVNAVFEQKTIGPPAGSSTDAGLRVGCMPFGGTSNFTAHGAMEDWVYWRTLLTDAQVLAQMAAAH